VNFTEHRKTAGAIFASGEISFDFSDCIADEFILSIYGILRTRIAVRAPAHNA
jgi:hypothetical protein